MTAIALPGPMVRPKLIVQRGPMIWTPQAEVLLPDLDLPLRRILEGRIKLGRKAIVMAGSLSNYAAKALSDLLWGKTAYAGETTIYAGLWAAALDDTFNGATGSECAYTSYARLALTNNTTIFAAGTGTGAYTKTFPSDATKSFAASTGTGTNNTVTYLGFLNGNAGTSGDKGLAWCSITSTTINSGDTPQLAQNAVTDVQD